ncbi:MAG: Gfo/Idh/MocA family oxidoreductase [Verrucomicrobia bacterium]|nr:Gfo/Idh/MocA family oxidoreductase [Verrucomicrobiota bacterium]
MPKELRIAIAGAGQMGAAHADAYRACNLRVVAVADSNPERAGQLAAAHGAWACRSTEEALRQGVDALSICLPHSLHFEAAMAAVGQGVALLIEKPHCITLAESRALRARCAERGVPAMAGFTHRFLATSRRLKAEIGSGRLGRVGLAIDHLVANGLGPAAPEWYGERALAGGGIAMIGMIHSIDRLRWLLAAEIESVQALVQPPVSERGVEDTALVLLQFSNGAQASLVAHRSPVVGHPRSHRYELFGERLNAYCSVGSFALQELHLAGAGVDERVTVTDDAPFVAEIREFSSALAEGRVPSPSLDEAEIALGAVLAIYESARLRRPILLREFLEQEAALERSGNVVSPPATLSPRTSAAPATGTVSTRAVRNPN